MAHLLPKRTRSTTRKQKGKTRRAKPLRAQRGPQTRADTKSPWTECPSCAVGRGADHIRGCPKSKRPPLHNYSGRPTVYVKLSTKRTRNKS